MTSQTNSAREALDAILCGSLSDRAQGILLTPPHGHRLEEAVRKSLHDAYGAGHPDLRILAPEPDVIKVDEIRKLGEFLASTRSDTRPGAMKTLAILRADRMNEAAANALLKSLEEPTQSTRILLVSDAPHRLPATILSRCIKLACTPDAEETLVEIAALIGDTPVDAATARSALLAADGDPSLAAEVISRKLDPWITQVMDWIAAGDVRATPPLSAVVGKDALGITSALRLVSCRLHLVLVEIATDVATTRPKPNWSLDQAVEACRIVSSALDASDRPGLDAKLRLHRAVSALAAL